MPRRVSKCLVTAFIGGPRFRSWLCFLTSRPHGTPVSVASEAPAAQLVASQEEPHDRASWKPSLAKVLVAVLAWSLTHSHLLLCHQEDSVSQSSSDAGLGSDHESDTLTIGKDSGVSYSGGA